MTDSPENDGPARRSYLFERAWRDWTDVARQAWDDCRKASRHSFAVKEDLSATFSYAMGVAQLVGGVAVIVLFNSLFALTLAAATVGFGLIVVGPALAELFYWTVHGLFSACPHCHERSALPAFICPKCGRLHERLTPDTHGVFFHRCLCGEKMPANFWNGRNTLAACCPTCRASLDSHAARKLCIPLTGAPEHGKSEFLYRACDRLFSLAAERGWKLELHGEEDRAVFANLSAQFAARELHKTAHPVPKALRLRLHVTNEAVERQLYLYDPAGEAFASPEHLDRHIFYEYSCGLIFLLDPFALPGVQASFARELESCVDSYRPPATDPEYCFQMLRLALEKCRRIRVGQRCALPVAVILTKGDVLGLAVHILQRAGANVDERCRHFLRASDAGGLVTSIESSVQHCRFFISGRESSTVPAEETDIAEPLHWLLMQADPRYWKPNSKT